MNNQTREDRETPSVGTVLIAGFVTLLLIAGYATYRSIGYTDWLASVGYNALVVLAIIVLIVRLGGTWLMDKIVDMLNPGSGHLSLIIHEKLAARRKTVMSLAVVAALALILTGRTDIWGLTGVIVAIGLCTWVGQFPHRDS